MKMFLVFVTDEKFISFVTDEEFAAEVPSGLEEDEDEPFFQVKEQTWHQHHARAAS